MHSMNPFFRTTFAAAAACPVVLSSAPETLDETVVEATRETLTSPGVEASREALARVAGGTDLVEADVFRERRTTNLPDLFAFTPGVFAAARAGGEESRLSIRGSGLQRTFHGRGIKLLLDGIPLNELDGSFDFQALDPLAASHVEVFRGANALRHGASTLGGAIQFVMPSGASMDGGLFRVEAGSFDTFKVQLAGGGTAGDADLFASFTHSESGGFRDYNAQRNERLFASAAYRPADHIESRFYLIAADADSELPGSLTKAQLRDDPRQAVPGNILRGDKRDFQLLRLANRTVWELDDSRVEMSAGWSHKELDHPIFYLNTGAFATGPGTIDQKTDTVSAEIRWTKKGEISGRDNSFTLGFSPWGGWGEQRNAENLPGRADGRVFGRFDFEAWNHEAYLENELMLRDDLALIAGLQAVHATRETRDRFLADGDDSARSHYDVLNPKIGLRWDADRSTQIFANFSRSFEPPTFSELSAYQSGFGPGALPGVRASSVDDQHGWTLEIGTRGKRGRFVWDLALYHAWLEDELLALNDAFGAPLGTINGGDTIHRGAEASLAVDLFESATGDTLAWRTVYQLGDFRFDGHPVYGNNRLAGLPRHLLRSELIYRHACGFYFGPGIEWMAEKYAVDHANTLFADPYLLVNFRAGYRKEDHWSAFLEFRNITDEKYAATTGVIANAGGADSAQFLPGDGFAVYGGFELEF